MSTACNQIQTAARTARVVRGDRAHRARGSVLVLVVGVLALMAIIVLVYSTIGMADRRSSAALVDRTQVREQEHALKDYIAQVIAENTFAVISNRVPNANNSAYIDRPMRQSWTYPSTEWSVQSQPDPNEPWRKFVVEGGIRHLWQTGLADPRAGSTPWLATISPAYLDAGLFDLNAVNGPIAGNGTADRDAFAFQQLFQDLLQVSLFAPDGRRVNLASIRGHFDAEPGFGLDAQGRFRTSANLWLLDQTGQPTLSMPWAGNLLADPNTPQNWNTKLFGHHRMVNQPINAALIDQQHGGLFNMANYMADADGDGYYDAPWQELYEISTGSPHAYVPQYGRMRWFFAPKAIDLSGLVNVNTATSFRYAPSFDYPSGGTPADVDLERLLTMRDVARLYGSSGTEELFSNPYYPNPVGSVDPASNYAGYDRPDGSFREYIGGAAYIAMLNARVYGAPDNTQRFAPDDQINGVAWMPNLVMDAQARSRGYREYSRNQRGAVALNALDRGFSSGYSLATELELRAYNGLNDLSTLSQLEMVLDGRAATRGLDLYGPMRGNRGTEYELLTYSDTRSAERAAVLHGTSIRGDMTTISGARPLSSDPTGHTVVADILTDPDVPGASIVRPRAITTSEVRPDAGDTIETIISAIQNPVNVDVQVHTLLQIYANALMADGGLFGATPAQQAVWSIALRNQVLNYGHRIDPATMATTPAVLGGLSAEIALRTSATMATNLLAERLYDRTGLRLAADELVQGNLIINNDRRSDLTNSGGNGPLTYWGLQPSGVNQPRLVMDFDLDRDLNPANTGSNGVRQSRLATDQVTGLDAVAGLQIYGVRPQPFLTQASYLIMYSNAAYNGTRAGNSRDAEWTEVPPGSGVFTPGPATIWAPVQTGNDDFLVEVFAVQVSNPFDRTIALSAVDAATGAPVIGGLPSPPAQQFRYYVEFAGRFFKLIDGGPNGSLTNGVELKPGESRVFYYTTQTLAAVAARWSASNPSGAAGGFTEDEVRQWIEFQLSTRVSSGVDIKPVRMVEFDRTTGRAAPTGVNIFSGPDSPAQRVVRLWRQVRSDAEETANDNADVTNDYLVDRLRDLPTASRPTLNVQLPPQANAYPISGTSVLPPDGTPAGDGAYNDTRFSITFYGSLRRSDDPATASSGKMLEGVFPAFAIEAKSSTNGFIARGYNNKEVIVLGGIDLPTSSPAQSWFTGVDATSQGYGARRLDGPTGLIERQSTSGAAPTAGVVPDHVLVKSLAQPAMTRHDPLFKMPKSLAWPEVANPPDFDQVYVPIRALPKSRALAQMELLGPLAVSATFDAQKFILAGGALGTGTQPPEQAIDNAWITLSEALALGTNYSSTLNAANLSSAGAAPELAYYHRFGDPQFGVVSRGRIVLDRFTSFNDTNGNGLFDQPNAAGALNANGVNSQYVDPARGLGIPMAWDILNNARVGGMGSITSMINGLVNINTAPLSVLRLLPMLSPDYEKVPSTTAPVWFADAIYQSQAGRALFLPDQEAWDIAAVLASYRDKSAGYARAKLNQSATVGAAFDFTDNNEGNQDLTAFPYFMADQKGRRNLAGFGRSATTGQFFVNQPVREAAGFASPIEILGARMAENFRYQGPTSAFMPAPRTDRADSSITRFVRRNSLPVPPTTARERVFDPMVGTTATGLAQAWTGDPDPASTTGALINVRTTEVPDSQEAQLAIASAVMNSVSVRSDVFCVWFVLEGYTRADTEGLDYYGSPTAVGLAADDEAFAKPMIPTVSRRFVMVVDRSNVIAPGQKPRILLFQELPR